MQLLIKRRFLEMAFGKVKGAIDSKSSLPILGCTLITATKNGECTLSATNLDMEISHTMPAVVQEPGRICVPFSMLQKVVKTFALDDFLSLSVVTVKDEDDPEDEGTPRFTVSKDSREFELNCLEAQDWPIMSVKPGETPVRCFHVDNDLLRRAEKRCLPMVSQDESRPMLCGVHMSFRPVETVIVATDGHRLAELVVDSDYSWTDAAQAGVAKVDMTVPERVFAQACKVVQKLEGQTAIELHKPKDTSVEYVVFQIGQPTDSQFGTRIAARLVDGEFPDYTKVMPAPDADLPTTITVEKEVLGSAVKAMSVVADSICHCIALIAENNAVEISTDRADVGSARESVPATVMGKPIKIGFNAEYVLDIIKAMEDTGITMGFQSPLMGAVFAPVRQAQGEALRFLVMPLRLHDYEPEEQKEPESQEEESETAEESAASAEETTATAPATDQ